jgi:hypothetical protein
MTKTPKVLSCYPDQAHRPFAPSNGTEGMIFTSAFCDRCLHEKFNHTQNDSDKKCDILTRSVIYWPDTQDPNYPSEWQYSAEGWPVCTSWQYWDWDNDGDPDDPDNPATPPPAPDPAQLDLFPLYPTEKSYNPKRYAYEH